MLSVGGCYWQQGPSVKHKCLVVNDHLGPTISSICLCARNQRLSGEAASSAAQSLDSRSAGEAVEAGAVGGDHENTS